jgi:hypothetical protein
MRLIQLQGGRALVSQAPPYLPLLFLKGQQIGQPPEGDIHPLLAYALFCDRLWLCSC